MTGSESAPLEKNPLQAVRLSRYLRQEAILEIAADSKEALLRAMVQVVVQDADASTVEQVYRAIEEREAAVNTYVGEGVAIPHARSPLVKGISMALARNAAGFPYGVETDQPVRIAVLVVGQESLHDEHVRVLGVVASRLRDPALREKIIHARDAQAVQRLLDAPAREKAPQKARPLAHLLFSYARRIGKELGVSAILVSTDNKDELSLLKRLPGKGSVIIATNSRRILEEAEKIVPRVILLPQVSLRREARIRLAALMAITNGLVDRDAVLVCLSSDDGGIDNMTILEIGREFGRFVAASGEVFKGVQPGVLERVIALATELAREGREGRPVGTLFVVGDPERLAPFCQQMVMNPFRGYPEEERNILDPTLAETIKEFASIDGAFVVRGDGVVASAGTYLKVDRDVVLPGGYGSRHRVACGITEATNCISVALSHSTGEVTMFKNGSVVLSLPRSSGR